MTPKTCSLESGKKLQALGVSVPSYFHWDLAGKESELCTKVPAWEESYAPAYLSGELGEMLPNHITHQGEYYELTIVKSCDDEWCVDYEDEDNNPLMQGDWWSESCKDHPILAEAFFLMLILLITEGYVTVEEINQ